MKHLTYADKSLLIGDDTADLLLEYAAALATGHAGDTVTLNAISSDGDEVEATLLLGQGAPVMAETSTTKAPEPDNTDANRYLRGEITGLRLRDLPLLKDNIDAAVLGDGDWD